MAPTFKPDMAQGKIMANDTINGKPMHSAMPDLADACRQGKIDRREFLAAAGVAGPTAFFSRIFSEDPHDPIVRTIIAVADNVSRGAFVTVGTVLALLSIASLVTALIRLLTVDRLRRPG